MHTKEFSNATIADIIHILLRILFKSPPDFTQICLQIYSILPTLANKAL